MRLQRVPNDTDYRMHCPNAGCGVDSTTFLMGSTLVEIHSEASAVPMVVMPDGKTHWHFGEGQVESVQCAKCKTTYLPRDAHTTT
jgi:hypothetical protein